MTRRSVLALAATPVFARPSGAGSVSSISAITDEIGVSEEDAIAFARQYGLGWVELRSVPGGRPVKGDYAFQEPEFIRRAAARLKDSGLRVSFLNTGMLKFGIPGTEPARARKETAEARAKRLENEARRFARRLDDLHKAIEAAHAFDVSDVRVFTGTRVADPAALLPRLADVLGEMSEIAGRDGVRLLVENEASCNVATCAELAAICKLVPSRWFGINWDALNGASLGEKPFPDGYRLLPPRRIGNVQIKGKSVMATPQWLDWAAIMARMRRDGYRGRFGLETHVFDGTLIAASHTSIREILRIAGELEGGRSRQKRTDS